MREKKLEMSMYVCGWRDRSTGPDVRGRPPHSEIRLILVSSRVAPSIQCPYIGFAEFEKPSKFLQASPSSFNISCNQFMERCVNEARQDTQTTN